MTGWQVSWESCSELRRIWTRKQFSSSGPGKATGPTLALHATSFAVTADAAAERPLYIVLNLTFS